MNKNEHQPYNSPRRVVSAADQTRGEEAEHVFRHWLDADVVPHLYIDQTPMSVPAPMRGLIKRPDYLVGVLGVGMIAFDVKSKSVYRDALIFDLDEVRKLRTFARVFHLTVFFACLDPAGGSASYWVRLDQLDNLPAVRRGGVLTISMPLDHAQAVSMQQSFHVAFVEAIALPLRV